MNKVRNPKDLDSHLIFKHATNLHDFNFWINNDLGARLEERYKKIFNIKFLMTNSD